MCLRVELAAGLLSHLEREAVTAAPYEACGLLLGRRENGGLVVASVAMSENVTDGDRKTTFEIDPALYIRMQKAARAGSTQVMGVWHSHPGGRPEPSDTDKARSVEGGWLWLITSVNGGMVESAGYVADEHKPQTMRAVALER